MAIVESHLKPRTAGFKLGALACPACGWLFPTTSDATALGCALCGTVVHVDPPVERLDFTAADLTLPHAHSLALHEKVTLESKSANVDQRATEETYCEKCKCTRECFVHAQQTRGADEGQTIFYECRTCKNEWSLNS